MRMKESQTSLINIGNEKQNKDYQKKYKTTPLRKWQSSVMANWEYKLLFDIGAINEHGIIPDYPVIEITKSDGDKIIEDIGGDIIQINIAIISYSESNKGEKARLKYIPRKYTDFRTALKELDIKKKQQAYAIKMNTPNQGDKVIHKENTKDIIIKKF